MAERDELVEHAQQYEAVVGGSQLPTKPSKQLAVVACMDSRIDVFALFGLKLGEAHVIRNAGGIITDDVLRSLTLSQRLLGTREVAILQHTKCGLHELDEEQLRSDIEAQGSAVPPWPFGSFSDVKVSVRDAVEAVRNSPFVPHTDAVSGFVYDVETGHLSEEA